MIENLSTYSWGFAEVLLYSLVNVDILNRISIPPFFN